MSKTELFVRKQSGGMFSITNESLNTGNIFWVCSLTGTDSVGYGQNPDAPFATLAYAYTQCTTSNDDRIYLLRGHAEAVIAAGTITLDKIGVSIIGLGTGAARPTFSWTTISSATMLMTGASNSISNCIFDVGNGITGLTSGIVISGAGCTIKNSTFLTSKAGTWIAPIQTILTAATANYLTLADNKFIGPALTTTTVSAGTSCICLVGGTGIEIVRNYIHGWFTTTTGCIYGITTLTNNCLIAHNFLGNQTTSSAAAITLLTGSTGLISNNRIGVLTGTAPIVSDATWWSNNYYAASKGSLGVIL